MFESALEAKFKKIFEVQKVSFAQPDPEAIEQECLFIQIDRSRNFIKDGRALARVEGRAAIVAQADKMPFGYFSKCIASHAADTLDLFFFEVDENTKLYQNIVQRGFSFVYFFNSQYDPDTGTITSITTEVTT